MILDRMQRQRFEYKYIISEEVALGVRDFVSGYLELDAYGATRPDLSYPVHSLYLDSPDLILYQRTINGDRNRFKLRLRFYENGDERPVYFEIKRRVNNTIQKKRAGVRREVTPELIAGQLPEARHLVRDTPEAREALESFAALLSQLRATPQSHVCYQREAWVDGGGNSVRITLDRQVQSEPRHSLSFCPWPTDPIEVFDGAVVLELKFTDRFPRWFNHLVQCFGLQQGSAAKYVDGIGRMSEHGRLYVGF
jgi:hypothetical protein